MGAGIARLAVATALSKNGKKHNVTVLESHPSLDEFGASIGITPTSTRALRSLGLELVFNNVVTLNKFSGIIEGSAIEDLDYLP